MLPHIAHTAPLLNEKPPQFHAIIAGIKQLSSLAKKATIKKMQDGFQFGTSGQPMCDSIIYRLREVLHIPRKDVDHQALIAGKMKIQGPFRDSDAHSNLVQRGLMVPFLR